MQSAAPKLPRVSRDGMISVLPVTGMISQRASIWQELFGGTSTESLSAAVASAANNSRVSAIVLDVDSPGGTVSGVQEAADIIAQARKAKPVYAVANSMALSAAYWLASAVGKGNFFGAPGAEVGSIGVFVMHEDFSAALEQDGVKISFIHAGEHKTEGNPFEPLSDDAKAHLQKQIDISYDAFVKSVARGRGVSDKRVREGFGGGRYFDASQAAEMGMIDGVIGLRDLVKKIGGQPASEDERASVQSALEAAWVAGTPQCVYVESEIQRRRRLRLLST